MWKVSPPNQMSKRTQGRGLINEFVLNATQYGRLISYYKNM